MLSPAGLRLPRPLLAAQVVNIVKDAFTSAGERDITTGDHVDIWVIDAQGVHQEKFDLKYD